MRRANQLKPASIGGDPNDEKIALLINPKRKGWAWVKGQPTRFGDSNNTGALMHWVNSQPFWHRNAETVADSKGVTWGAIYTDMCLELSESRCTKERFHSAVKDMVVAAIEEFEKSQAE